MTRFTAVSAVVIFFALITPPKQLFAEQRAGDSTQADRAPAAALEQSTLTLDQCIALALANNPGLLNEREKIVELEQEYRIAASALYPKLTVSAYYQRLDDDRLGVQPGMLYEQETLVQAKVKQVLFDGGKTWNSRKAAAQGAESQRESSEGTRLDTVFAVSQAYYRVLEARELVQVNETSREQREAFHRLTEAFRKAGKATKLESLKAEAQLLDAERSLSQAREAARVSELILKKTIGMDLRTAIVLADALPTGFSEPADEEELLRRALAGNPDLKKISRLKEQAEASLHAAYGPMMPEISLQGSYGYRDRNAASGADEWTAGVFLEWSLFEGGLTTAQIARSRSKMSQISWTEKALRDQVQVDLREALGNARTALASVRSSQRLVEAQDEAYKAAMAFYKRGKSTYIEVLAAQVDLTQAKAAYVRAVGDYQTAQARLGRVVGAAGPEDVDPSSK